jgi:type I restriction enzyme, S subunit
VTRSSDGQLVFLDSETWDDIGVPALAEYEAEDLLCGYHLALLRPSGGVAGQFLFRALQCKPIAYQFHVEANGVTRFGLSHAAIKSVWLPIAPLTEQTAIVRFLDHADRKISRHVHAKQELIKLLNEQRQVIVHRAVTRGLNHSISLEPSGVPGLGDIPQHWK